MAKFIVEVNENLEGDYIMGGNKRLITCKECVHRMTPECPLYEVQPIRKSDWYCGDGKLKEGK